MNTLNEYRCKVESLTLCTKLQSIIPEMDRYHQNHIRERLYRCGLIDNSYSRDLDTECIGDIWSHIQSKEYRYIIDKYIVPTYEGSDTKKDQYDFFVSLRDENLMWYLSVGVLCERASILKRNNIEIPFINDIDIESYIERMMNISIKDDILRRESPTYYINSLMYCYNLSKHSCDISDVIKRYINDIDINDYRYMYGLTHIIIQSSNFYNSYVEDTYKLGDILESFIKKHPISIDTYIDLYCEVLVCLKLLRRRYIWKKSISSIRAAIDKLKPLDIKHEHTYSLYILLWNLII